jgi:hypothetical protein
MASVKNIYEILRQKELDCARLENEIQALRLAIPLLAEEHPEPEAQEQEDESFSTQESTGTDGPTPSSSGGILSRFGSPAARRTTECPRMGRVASVGKPNSSPRRGPRSRIVPIELLLQIRLGVLDSQDRAQRSRELLAHMRCRRRAWHSANLPDCAGGETGTKSVARSFDCLAGPLSSSIVKTIAKFGVDFSWIVPVKAAEALAVVEFHAAVRYIQGVQRCGELLAEIAEGKIEGRVLRKVVPWIWLPRKRVAKAVAVIHVGGSKRAPRKSDVPAKIKGISLIAIEWEELARR